MDISRYIPHSHFANAIATFFLVAVGIWGIIETKRALILSERAWLTVGGPPSLSRALTNGEPIIFILPFQNSGKTPAYNVTVTIQNFTVTAFPEETDMIDVTVPKNETCTSLEPSEGRYVVPPSQPGFNSAVTEDSIHGHPPFRIDNRVINGALFYGFNGCAAYRTLGEIHRTSFCFILQRLLRQSQSAGKQETVPVYTFTTCGIGFNAD